jgi:squalene-hopene/tetraprenyl-beta-curcumene cyclase
MVDSARVLAAAEIARQDLLAEREPSGHWIGRLASSSLSTATAISALALVDRHAPTNAQGRFTDERRESRLSEVMMNGIQWLAQSQNADGGWGDTDLSLSNIATTMLARAAFGLTGVPADEPDLLESADAYIKRSGGARGVRRRYGRDKTFAAPILANAALAGLVPWRDVPALPFELACLPRSFWRWARLPVVSYAIPALIAIGMARHHHRRPWNPIFGRLRDRMIPRGLEVLLETQPASGGYLEAVPLTSFVVMSLASVGQASHPVAVRGAQFLLDSVRPDGSWPIDTNLATWNTTLAINALAAGDMDVSRLECFDWLLSCQHRSQHPFTGAAPGAWAWTDLSGGVPDADDTSGALLALWHWREDLRTRFPSMTDDRSGNARDAHPVVEAAAGDEFDVAAVEQRILASAREGVYWLLDLQNRDGGWPTFCRGWGLLPFDRSGADLTGHVLRALHVWADTLTADEDVAPSARHLLASRLSGVVEQGFNYLRKSQRKDGSWIPLWFGNQWRRDEANPIYGTARVLLAFCEIGRLSDPAALSAVDWLVTAQNGDGGWGGRPAEAILAGQPAPATAMLGWGRLRKPIREVAKKSKTSTVVDGLALSSVEETALAVEALLSCLTEPRLLPRAAACQAAAQRGITWLVGAVEDKRHQTVSPIGFYFAKLWYYEKLYPLMMTTAALGRAARQNQPQTVGPNKRSKMSVAK